MKSGRGSERDDGKWHDDAECAIKYFYGPQGQGRRIVIERNNYFTRLSLRLSLSLRFVPSAGALGTVVVEWRSHFAPPCSRLNCGFRNSELSGMWPSYRVN